MEGVNGQSDEEIDSVFYGIALDAALLMLTINCPYSINRENCPAAEIRNLRDLSLKEKQEIVKQLPEERKKEIFQEHIMCVKKNRYKLTNPAQRETIIKKC